MDEEEMMMWANDFVEDGERDEMFTESGGGCFIATAAFGTPFAKEINVLRNWRDNWLLKNKIGTIFVHLYYKFSPPLANNIRLSKKKRFLTRELLTPVIKILSGKYK
tara:strand:+ start:792 stop:1112 length:321 start_codon:yes stop_codon:yes gene_type:complete